MDNDSIKLLIDIPPTDRTFRELVIRCYQKHPSPEDLQELRHRLHEEPNLYRSLADISQVVRAQLISKLVDSSTGALGVKSNLAALEAELGYEQASAVEKLLIENILNCWLRYQWVEHQLAGYMGLNEVPFAELEFWEKRLSITQRRYLRACETLVRVRRLMRGAPALQVNIATQNGQQVNIAGEFIKT